MSAFCLFINYLIIYLFYCGLKISFVVFEAQAMLDIKSILLKCLLNPKIIYVFSSKAGKVKPVGYRVATCLTEKLPRVSTSQSFFVP